MLWCLGYLGAMREQCFIFEESLLQDAVKEKRKELPVPNVWWETRKSEGEAAKEQGGKQPLHVLCSGGALWLLCDLRACDSHAEQRRASLARLEVSWL